jgi:hypothetical protein
VNNFQVPHHPNYIEAGAALNLIGKKDKEKIIGVPSYFFEYGYDTERKGTGCTITWHFSVTTALA